MIIEILFSHEPVLPGGQAMIGREDHISVGRFSRFLQSVENTANLLIHIGNVRIVFGAV